MQTLHGHSSGDLLRVAVVYPVEIIIKLYKHDKVVQMRTFASGKNWPICESSKLPLVVQRFSKRPCYK